MAISRQVGTVLLHGCDHLLEGGSIDQDNVIPLSERPGLGREGSVTDYSAVQSICIRHGAAKLAHHFDANSPVLPVLALHQRLLPIAVEDEVNPPIAGGAARLFDNIALSPIGFTHKRLELAP
jgi:hypothetical protein